MIIYQGSPAWLGNTSDELNENIFNSVFSPIQHGDTSI